jgi:hypothetical protein
VKAKTGKHREHRLVAVIARTVFIDVSAAFLFLLVWRLGVITIHLHNNSLHRIVFKLYGKLF